MKKIISILGVISLFAACTAELDTTPEITEEQAPIIEKAPVLYASIEEGAETKVYLDENYKVLWHADDRISVFNKDTYNLQYRFDGNTGDNSGTFSEVPDGLLHTSNTIENLYAVYPYSASTSISNTSVLTVNYPAAQTYSAGSFGLGANTMVAVTDANNLQFKNACGYLMFKLYGTNVKVKTISLRGHNHEKIAGEATITMSLGGDPVVAMSGSATEEIVLTCTDAVTIGTSSGDYTEFWFAIPPVIFTGGFTVTVTDEDGKVFCKSTTSSLEIVRSYAKKMQPIEVVTATPNYLCFTSLQDDSTVSLENTSNSPDIEYSTDLNSWTVWDYSPITVPSGNTIYFRGNNPNGFSFEQNTRFSRFVMTGRFAAAGNLLSLLYGDTCDNHFEIPNDYCFHHLFFGAGSSLTSPPDLPATTLTNGCYMGMFVSTAITTAPALPAESLAITCYSDMFRSCTSLTSAPALPATTLANYCYRSMFDGCTNLTSAPALPATTLALGCYKGMFKGCGNLDEAPTLPAEALFESCYESMFENCTSLTSGPTLSVTTLAKSCYKRMFYGCSGITSFTSLPATTLAESCYEEMFRGCTGLINAPYRLSATVLAKTCYKGMFRGCNKLTTAPILPALSLAEDCYQYMFYGCSRLNYIKAMFTSLNLYSLESWVYGVAASGTYVKNKNADYEQYGTNAIPSGWTIQKASS